MQVIQQVHDHKRKLDFMMDFHNDPIVFLNKLVDNQIRDYKVPAIHYLTLHWYNLFVLVNTSAPRKRSGRRTKDFIFLPTLYLCCFSSCNCSSLWEFVYVEDAVASYIFKHSAQQNQVKVNLNIPPQLLQPATQTPTQTTTQTTAATPNSANQNPQTPQLPQTSQAPQTPL